MFKQIDLINYMLIRLQIYRHICASIALKMERVKIPLVPTVTLLSFMNLLNTFLFILTTEWLY